MTHCTPKHRQPPVHQQQCGPSSTGSTVRSSLPLSLLYSSSLSPPSPELGSGTRIRSTRHGSAASGRCCVVRFLVPDHSLIVSTREHSRMAKILRLPRRARPGLWLPFHARTASPMWPFANNDNVPTPASSPTLVSPMHLQPRLPHRHLHRQTMSPPR